MSIRETYLSALQSELKTKIQSVDSNYSTDVVKVNRGVYIWEDMGQYPSMNIHYLTDEPDATFGHAGIRTMNIELTLYLKPKNLDDIKDLDLFIRDIHYFLERDFTYSSQVIVNDFEVYEGRGDKDPVLESTINISIWYDISTI